MNLGLFFLLSVFLLVGAEDVRIYHRLWDGISQPPPQFTLRTIGDGFNVSNAQETLTVTNHAHDVYQIAVRTSSDPSSWIVSSTKACFLSSPQDDTVTLHLTPSNQPYALNYFVHPTPKDAKCPSNKPAGPRKIVFTNTEVIVTHHTLPPQPELKAPVPISITGEPIKPPPEKSFIQKYWVYLLIALVGVLLSGGGPPEDEQGSRTAQNRS